MTVATNPITNKWKDNIGKFMKDNNTKYLVNHNLCDKVFTAKEFRGIFGEYMFVALIWRITGLLLSYGSLYIWYEFGFLKGALSFAIGVIAIKSINSQISQWVVDESLGNNYLLEYCKNIGAIKESTSE